MRAACLLVLIFGGSRPPSSGLYTYTLFWIFTPCDCRGF
jgi:hypothetical protein